MTLPPGLYAKTITGKAKKQGDDLSTVSTEKLLNDPTYSTHPERAEELTRRTIKAIKYYNANVATETADRWCITQSVITSLIGSRAATIGKILESFRNEVECAGLNPSDRVLHQFPAGMIPLDYPGQVMWTLAVIQGFLYI